MWQNYVNTSYTSLGDMYHIALKRQILLRCGLLSNLHVPDTKDTDWLQAVWQSHNDMTVSDLGFSLPIDNGAFCYQTKVRLPHWQLHHSQLLLSTYSNENHIFGVFDMFWGYFSHDGGHIKTKLSLKLCSWVFYYSIFCELEALF